FRLLHKVPGGVCRSKATRGKPMNRSSAEAGTTIRTRPAPARMPGPAVERNDLMMPARVPSRREDEPLSGQHVLPGRRSHIGNELPGQGLILAILRYRDWVGGDLIERGGDLDFPHPSGHAGGDVGKVDHARVGLAQAYLGGHRLDIGLLRLDICPYTREEAGPERPIARHRGEGGPRVLAYRYGRSGQDKVDPWAAKIGQTVDVGRIIPGHDHHQP